VLKKWNSSSIEVSMFTEGASEKVLEASVGQSSNLYKNVVHFINISVDETSVVA